MPLPSDPKSPWPPKDWAPIQREISQSDAWYSGSEAKLSEFYGGIATPDARTRRRFWGRANRDTQGAPTERQRLHVPAAADVAATSADLLFGQTPTFDFPDSGGDTAAGDRLAELGELNGFGATLLEAAEVCSALGGVFLRPVWDPAVADHPLLSIVHADCAVPEFAWGVLTAVTFWQVVQSEGGKVLRHLERHEPGLPGQPGVIIHGLYAGTLDAIGGQIPLAAWPALANLAVNDDGVINLPAGIVGLDVRYVKNVGPNRMHRGVPIGRSDFQSTDDLMDALDETYTSWMRDVRLGKARLLVPQAYLERRPGRGTGASFDMDAEVFAPLDIEPSVNADKLQITANQFEIRNQQHLSTALALFERIVVTAGYSPQSFGMSGDGAEQTATEVAAREGKSDRTTDRKRRYWTRALEDMGEMLLIIDKAMFSGQATPSRPRLVWPEDPDQTPLDQANTLNYLAMAQAASTKVRVETLHPDWSDDQVDAEVSLIQQEHALVVPDPTGAGQFGTGGE